MLFSFDYKLEVICKPFNNLLYSPKYISWVPVV
jgi:hypothetical protein